MPVDLIVTPESPTSHRATLRMGERAYPCVLGHAGARIDKREGDGATPVGRFALRCVLYRADRGPPPQSVLPADAIATDDGWCDASEDPAYNKPVKLPYGASAECMHRDDALYDIVVVLGHNDDPVVPGAGSAIFLHVAPADGSATHGCIAVAIDDLRAILKDIGAGSAVLVRL